MTKPYDYGYDFDFPRGYHPGYTENADQYYFCQKTFDNYVKIIESCVFHVKGPLTGTLLKLEKWQKDIVAATFCILHKETHKRRYSEVFIYVPRKNGKSLFCSGLVTAYMIVDKEKGKEVVSVASSADQAAIIYKPIRLSLNDNRSPVSQSTNPNTRFKVMASPRQVISENELNLYRPLTADGDTNHGLNVSFSIMDEMHAWKQKQGLALYEAIVTSSSTRENPLNIIITTADYNRDSMCNDKFRKGQRICERKVDDPHYLPVLYYLDQSEDWTKEENWYKCNPQLGKSIFLEFYRKEVKKALSDPSYTNSCKRLYFNIQTQSESKFLDYSAWIDSPVRPDSDFYGESCYGGLDLAYKDDLCALVLEFPGEKKHVISRMWIPKEHPKIKFYIDKGYVESGEVILTEGNGIDFRRVKHDIVDLCSKFHPVEIAYDPRYATELCQSLYNDHNLPMVELAQTANNLSEPLKDLAVLVTGGKFTHDGNMCAAWQLGNATSKEMPNEQIKLVKPTGNDRTLAKVDFVAALSMAHNRLLFDDEGSVNDSLRKQFARGESFF